MPFYVNFKQVILTSALGRLKRLFFFIYFGFEMLALGLTKILEGQNLV